MQISASTLQAQQTARVATPQPAGAATFAPLNFKQAAKAPQAEMPPLQAAAPTTQTAAPTPGGYIRPGTHIDIKI